MEQASKKVRGNIILRTKGLNAELVYFCLHHYSRKHRVVSTGTVIGIFSFFCALILFSAIMVRNL
jgi:hypothetical protein